MFICLWCILIFSIVIYFEINMIFDFSGFFFWFFFKDLSPNAIKWNAAIFKVKTNGLLEKNFFSALHMLLSILVSQTSCFWYMNLLQCHQRIRGGCKRACAPCGSKAKNSQISLFLANFYLISSFSTPLHPGSMESCIRQCTQSWVLKGHWTIFWNFIFGWISFIM